MARKKKHPEHVNHERWLVSYADFITLLFAFFVVMFAISQVDSKKLGRFAESVQTALGLEAALLAQASPASLGGEKPVLVNLAPAASSRRAAELMERIARKLDRPHLEKEVGLGFDRRGVKVSLSEAGFFDVGSATIRTDALSTLEQVARALKDVGQPLTVEGHTDNVPINTSLYPSNWELSTARATSIVRYLVDRIGFDAHKIAATGYAENRPVGDNSTPEGRALNRRVDVVVLTNALDSAPTQ